MFKVNQLVRYCGMPMVVISAGRYMVSRKQVLALQFPCALEAPAVRQAMVPPHIIDASEVEGLIGNNYQAKPKCSR